MFQTVARAAYDHPWRVLVAVLGLSVVLLVPFRNFAFHTDLDAFLPSDSEARHASDVLREEFGSQTVELILIYAFFVTDEPALREMRMLEDALREQPVVVDVHALTSLLEDQGEAEPWRDWEMLFPALQAARDLPEWRGYVSSDGTRSLMRVTVDDDASNETVIAQIEDAVASMEFRELELEISGVSHLQQAIQETSRRENARLFAFAIVAMGALLYANFRRLFDSLVLLGIGTLALLWSMGLFLASGQPFTVISIAATPLIIGIGIDYGLHYLNRYYEERAAGAQAAEAIGRASGTTGFVILLTAATTVVSFSSFAVTGFEPIEHFGILAAMGVGFAALITIVVLPAAFRLRDGSRKAGRPLGGILGHSGVVTLEAARLLRRPWLVAGAVAVSLGVVALNAGSIQTGSLPTRVDSEAQRTMDRVVFTFGDHGGATVLIPLEAARETLSAFRFLEELEDTGARVVAPWFPLDEGGGGNVAPEWVSERYARVQLIYRPHQRADLVPAVQGVVEEAGFETHLAGRDVASTEIQQRVGQGLQRSLAVTVPTVLVLLALGLRSVRLAVLAVGTLGLVIAWKLGLMPLADIRLSVTTATTAALVVGLGMDFAIHIVHRYREELGRMRDRFDAMERTLATAGRPIFGSALTTTTAFLILATSQVNDLRDYGLLTALAIVLSFVACLTVLPPVLVRVLQSGR